MVTGKFKLFINWFPLLAGVLLLILGIVVTIGWNSHLVTLIQIFPQLAPMQYNTALGFIASGLALITISARKGRLTVLLGIIIIAIGGLTGFQYLAGFDLGIDQLFMDHYITIETSHPGRMAPNTALSFILTGIGLLAVITFHDIRRRSWVIGVAGGLVLGLGLVAVFGYIFSLSAAYGWNSMTRMAIHTAAGFFLLGAGLVSIARQTARSNSGAPEYSSNWWPISAAAFTFCFALLLSYALEVNELNLINAKAASSLVLAPLVVLVFGIIMGILLGVALWLNRTATLRAIEAEELAKRLTREEVALKDSEERFQLIAETIKGVFFIISADYQKIYYVSPEYEKWSGRDRQYLYDNRDVWEEWIHPDDRAIIRRAVAGRVEGDFTTKMPDYRIHRPDHPDRWVSSETYPARNEKGEIIRYIGFISDITQRKLAEETLKKSEERLRQIAETVNDIFFILSPDYQQVIYLSPNFRKVYGKSHDGLCDAPESMDDYVQHWVYSGDWEMLKLKMEKRLKGDYRGDGPDYRIIRHDGSIRWVSSCSNTVRDEQGRVTYIIGTITEVTERRLLENKLRQAQKMEAVGQLTGGIAHDFNNILGIIMGNLEILKKSVPDNSKAMERVEKALNGVERGAKLTGKLLSFSRKKSYISEVISVNQFIRNLKELIAKSLTVSITVKTVLAENLWAVDVDSGDLEDAILNISLNARDAMPDGGTLLIETANKILDDNYVNRNPDSKAGEFVMISISDTGCGIPPATQEKILEPFFTTKSSGKGTGLGLSMVHGFIKRSGGHIKIYSEEGKGTTFRLYLPKSVTESGHTHDNMADQESLPRGDETVLVVDDEVALCEAAEDQLRHLGYSVLAANNAEEALGILRNNQNIDLLFSDIVMPGNMDGYELARETLKTYPDLKILLTSGFTQNREKYLNNGNRELSMLARNLLSKPYNLNELSFAIRKTLDESG